MLFRSFIHSVKESVNIPVIANGDIKSFQDAQDALRESGADGIMIGRAAYGRPWFINQVDHYLKTNNILSEPSVEEKKDIIQHHLEDMVQYYGELTGVRMARKHLGWYSSGMDNSAEFRMRVNNSTSLIELKRLLKNFFN